jgi:hypothetical protein
LELTPGPKGGNNDEMRNNHLQWGDVDELINIADKSWKELGCEDWGIAASLWIATHL